MTIVLKRTLNGSLILGLMFALSACASSPPKNLDDVCEIFREKSGWYADVAKASKRWSTPISVIMAFIHQESRFKATAKPPRRKILWIIPGPRPSNAYGYPQALKETWKRYQRESGNSWADRDEFEDAVDFIGWYNQLSVRKSYIKATDAYHLYLAYHEGHSGFNLRSYKNKSWLKTVAKKVSKQARRYQGQLQQCEADLKARKGIFGWF